ncbi:MAG: Gfo/Idh/MocA family oxidoreductase, partial [Phycisphaerae bacterium]|nr:Gfo/Idh/MocA family oxidoreductase [Phycisphaerae bacterium]
MSSSHISRRQFIKTSAISASALGASAAALSLSASTSFGEPSESVSKEGSKSGSNVIRVGMIGLDTSHCIVYTKLFAEHPEWGVRMAWVYPSSSPDIQTSRDRVEGYKKEISEKYQVKVVDSAEQIAELADAIMIESNDGRRHLKDLQAVVAAGKPTFIDKPFAASLDDAKAMVKLVKKHKLPCFSSSAMRFDGAFQEVLAEKEEKFGKIIGVDAYSPAYAEPTNPGLFWYGIHGVEILYTLMGRGCQ